MSTILIIDGGKSVRNTLKDILEYEKHQVLTTDKCEEAAELISKKHIDLILCDAELSECVSGGIFTFLKSQNKCIPVIITSTEDNVTKAVSAMKRGAADYILKPFDINELLTAVRKSLQPAEEEIPCPCSGQTQAKRTVKGSSNKEHTIPEIVGNSPQIMQIKEMIEMVAPSEARVMITGCNGTGKELVAKWLHALSMRSQGPLIEVNCAAIPSELIESEMFGHEKGSFTSANQQHKGFFEQADGGTLFLDEIGDMSLSAQSKVLRALQEKKITRIGGTKDIPVNVRVIAATNKDLKAEIAKGNFREDLFHRISVVEIHVPTLNERISDLDLLIRHFIGTICKEDGYELREIEPEAVALLQKKNWSGNIRELHNVVERLIIFSQQTITKEHVTKYVPF